MWLGDKWHEWQAWRAQRYLARYPGLGVDVLRRDSLLAARTFEAWAASDKTGPERDSYPYPGFVSMAYGGKTPLQRSLPKSTPWNLRRFSEYPPSRRAINVMTNPILELPFTIALRRPPGLAQHEAPPEPTADQTKRILAATEMFGMPNNELDGRTFLEMLLEDLLVFGAAVFEVAPNTSDTRPLFLWPVDAQSIRINLQWEPGSATFHYSQGKGYLYGSVGVGDEVKFQDDALCYARLNPRASTPFGLGYLEVAFDTVNSFIGAFAFATRRASNETPNFGLFLGENLTPEMVRRFQHYWENEIEGNGKVPIIGGGRQPTAFNFNTGAGRDPLWLAWQEWQVRVIAMAFGVSPMRLGLERDVNRSTAAQGASDDWATIAPVANTLRQCFTHWLLWKRLGWRDLEFQWQVRSSDEMRLAQVLAEQYAMNAITVDEIRAIYERPPLPDGLGDMVRTPFEEGAKAAAQPEPPAPIIQAPGAARPGGFPPRQPAVNASTLNPFGDMDADMLSPEEAAFLREFMAHVTPADFAVEED